MLNPESQYLCKLKELPHSALLLNYTCLDTCLDRTAGDTQMTPDSSFFVLYNICLSYPRHLCIMSFRLSIRPFVRLLVRTSATLVEFTKTFWLSFLIRVYLGKAFILDHSYPGKLAIISWLKTTGSLTLGETGGQTLGYLLIKVLFCFLTSAYIWLTWTIYMYYKAFLV